MTRHALLNCIPCLLFLVCLPGRQADAQEWTRFRGPNGSGLSDATIPVTWTDSDYNWKAELPGVGHSSPVLWGGKIFLTSAFEDTATRMVLCLNAADGKILWQRDFPSSIHKKHVRNSFASSTPAVDEERVYVVWSAPDEYTLMALDHDGNPKWSRNLGPFVSQHSCGTSPIVYEDMVILGNDQGDDKAEGVSFLVALDRRNGDTRWQTRRRTENVAYSTPCVYQAKGEPPQLIFNSGAHGISSIDPKSGTTNWDLDVFDKRSVSSPVIAGGLIFGSCGSGGGGHYVVALRPGSANGSRAPQIAYRIDESAPYVPSLIAKDDLLFLWSDNGTASCVRVADGKQIWRKRIGENFSGSPVCAGGRLYAMDDNGVVVVLAASENYEVLGRNPLGEPSRSTPAVAGGRMYLRTYSHLFSIGGK